MLNQADLCLMEELPDPDVLETIPEIRHLADRDEDLGLRSILEHPDVLWKAWRQCVLRAA